MNFENERFESFIDTHVFNRIKFYVYDKDGDETYSLDMPQEVFKHILELMQNFERVNK